MGTRTLASSAAMTTGWAFDDGTWYWSDSSGALASGWLSLDAWYWLDTETYQMQEGWRLVNENWYYLSPANGGRMCTGWTAINGLWYLFDNSGSMLTGWQNINGYWYLLNEDGSMATGWTGPMTTGIGSINRALCTRDGLISTTHGTTSTLQASWQPAGKTSEVLGIIC